MTRKPSPAASKKRESEQRKERELFSWHSPFPLGGESERAIFAFVTLVCCKHTIVRRSGNRAQNPNSDNRKSLMNSFIAVTTMISWLLFSNDQPQNPTVEAQLLFERRAVAD